MKTQYHQKKKTYTPQLRQKEARPRLCLKCGVQLEGWHTRWHKMVCPTVKAAQHQMSTGYATLVSTPNAVTGKESFQMETDGSTGYERDESEEESCSITSIAFQDEDNKSNTNAIATEVSAYLSSLTTLEPAHIGECLHWGPTQSTTSELTRVVAKFLRVTMLGDGLSQAHMQAILEFTHDMGGKKAALLPKKVKGCWRALTKVFA